MNNIDTHDVRDDARKDPATLEREIDQTRADMDRTLGALERKLSPGQLLDQAMDFAGEHAGEFASNLGRSVKENPMPALLMAVGVAWLVASSNRPKSVAYDYNERFEPQSDIDSVELDETADDHSVLSKAGQRAKASAEGALAGAGQRLKAAAEGTRQKLSSSRGAVEARMRRTSDTAQVQAQRAREGIKNLFEEQPLLIGALGIAVGAAIGAALPATEQEDRLLGAFRDKTMSEVKQRGAETYSQVRETVSRVGEEAKQAISGSTGQSSGDNPVREASPRADEEGKFS